MPIDANGRKIDYLRLSVTDRCNFNCVYCQTSGKLPREKIFSLEELAYVAQVCKEMGFNVVKLTGGEPLLRKNLTWLVSKIAAMGFKDFSLTTNGYYLEKEARDLKEAGLHRVTVSLDSLKKIVFNNITAHNSLNQVLKGIDKAIKVFGRIKLNTVIIKGINDNQIPDFVQMAKNKPIDLRFIELIPNKMYEPVQITDIKTEIDKLVNLNNHNIHTRGPAETYRIRGNKSTIGFISLRDQAFCSSCSRLRVIAKGMIKPCLYDSEEVDLISKIRNGTEEEVKSTILRAVHVKPAKHGELVTDMRECGG